MSKLTSVSLVAFSVICHIVSYLTLVSNLDVAPDPNQFVASPSVRYINSGCCLWTP